jgi:hypothetical protein
MAWSIGSASRSVDAGAFSFVFERADGREVSALVIVSWYAEKGLAYLNHARLERLLTHAWWADRDLEFDLARWVHEHEDEVLSAAMGAQS